jgi:hypothetical protein
MMPPSGIKGALFYHSPSKPYLEVKVHSKQLKTKFKAWGENMRPAKSCAPHFWTIQDDEDRQEKSSTPHFSSIEKSAPHFSTFTGLQAVYSPMNSLNVVCFWENLSINRIADVILSRERSADASS